MMPILAPHRPEDFYDSNDGEDDALAVQRCLNDAVTIAQERGGHDVELSGTYLLSSKRSLVVTPGANLTIYGRHRSAGFRSTNSESPFYLTGPTGAGERVAIIEPAAVKSRTIRVADISGITLDRLIEIRQILPATEEPRMSRWQQARVTEINDDVLTLDSLLDFPLDPELGESSIWPYDVASGLIVDTVTFDGAVAVLQRFRDSRFDDITGQARFVYGYGNRFSGIQGQPSFAYQSAGMIVDATAHERFLDFDGCSGIHADILRSKLMAIEQRCIKLAGCSHFRISRAEISGTDYTGLSITEGCYDVVADRVDASHAGWAVWTNGRRNEKTAVKAFAGACNEYDLYAADPIYFRRESGDGAMGYPDGSDVA